jgi:hypothetical protein
MTRIYLQFNAPIHVELEVQHLDEESILDALYDDLRNPESMNNWSPSYDNLKDIIRNGGFLEDDFEQMVSDCSFIMYN